MKINELRQVIRQVVREEVASEVSKAMGKVLVEMVREIKSPSNDKQPINEEAEEIAAATNAPVIKTKNPKLNSVLAETARNFKANQQPREGTSLVDLVGGFDKIGKGENADVAEPVTKIDYLKSIITENTHTNTPSVLDAGSDVPDMLKNVFKKDFRATMKAVAEKAKAMRPM